MTATPKLSWQRVVAILKKAGFRHAPRETGPGSGFSILREHGFQTDAHYDYSWHPERYKHVERIFRGVWVTWATPVAYNKETQRKLGEEEATKLREMAAVLADAGYKVEERDHIGHALYVTEREQ